MGESATATYTKKVRISVDESTWYEVPAKTASLELSRPGLDDTNMAETSGYRSRVPGLRSWSSTFDGIVSIGNTALAALRSQALNRTALFEQYLIDGTVANGMQGKIRVASYNQKGDVNGLETFTVNVTGSGALADAS